MTGLMHPSRSNLGVVTNFAQGVALGRVRNWELIPRFGYNPTAGTTTEDVWTPGGIRVDPVTAAQAQISSDSANDTALGTGAQAIYLAGLDGDYAKIEEVIPLDGTNTVSSVLSFLRINVMRVIAAGSTNGNEGEITCLIGGNVQAQVQSTLSGIAHGRGVSQQIHYTVPAGHTAYVEQVESWSGRDQAASIEMYVRDTDENGNLLPWFSPGEINIYRAPVTVEVFSSVVLPEKSEIKFVARSDSGTVEINMYATLLQGVNVGA